MKKTNKFITWTKVNKWYLLSYVIIAVAIVVISNVCLENEINSSLQEIQDELDYGIFSNKKSFGTRNESYTIVKYAKAEIPKIKELSDSSSYNQQYGGLKHYFKASGGWEIRLFKRNETSVTETHITPYAVGIDSEFDSDPESLFSRTYYNLIKDEDYNIDINNEYKISKLTSLQSKFHHIESNLLKIDDDILWYNYPDGKGYVGLELFCNYYIKEKTSKIDMYRALYSIVSLVLFTIIFFLIMKYHKRKTKGNSNLEISLNQHSENVETTTDEIDDLIRKLDPRNFMNPYNPDKVKISNDLYAALLNAKGNETIISIIKEKAESELGIK